MAAAAVLAQVLAQQPSNLLASVTVCSDLFAELMEQQQPVRRRYTRKQRPRPREFVPVCPPLAAEPHQPNRKRTWAGARVQLGGQRFSCSVTLRGALMARLQQERDRQETWTAKQWERVAQRVGREDWGAGKHGGFRTKKVKPPAVGEQQAVSAQGQVEEGSIISAVGEELRMERHSAVSQDESSAIGQEPREEGQVAQAVSAVGEEHARAEDKDSVIAECGTPRSWYEGSHPSYQAVLPPEPTTLKTQRLAGYTVLELIASGSYGDVYKASWKSTGELFAIKVMTKCRKTAKMTTEQERELSLMKGLSRKHEHVVNLLGWRETYFNVQLFMPLYDQTLRQYIRGHSVPLHAGKTIVQQLSSAVAYLHDCSILHRDIKPPNILVKHQPLAVGQPLAVVLSDFGCAKEIRPVGLEKATEQPMTPKMVTLYYRAPEILMGLTYALPSDAWSTGITFVEVEQGHPPFQIQTECKLLREIDHIVGRRVQNLEVCTQFVRQSARRWGQTYGNEFQALVDSMLAFDPDNRISARVAAQRSCAWSQPLVGSVQLSSASQHSQPLAGPA